MMEAKAYMEVKALRKHREMTARAKDRNHHERKFPHLMAVDMVELSGLTLAVAESTSTMSRSSVYFGGFFEEPCANRLCTSPEGLNRETKTLKVAAICKNTNS